MTQGQFFLNLKKPVIGMIHLLPLPGSAAYDGRGIGPVVERALADGRALAEGGVDAILIQNTGDLPATSDGGPETIAHMTMIGTLLRQEIQTPLGVNILANGAESALAVAQAISAAFVRIKVYVGAVVGIGGVMQGAAQRAQDFIRRIGAADIEIAADVYDRTSRPPRGDAYRGGGDVRQLSRPGTGADCYRRIGGRVTRSSATRQGRSGRQASLCGRRHDGGKHRAILRGVRWGYRRKLN